MIDSLVISNASLEGAFFIEKTRPDKFVLNHIDNGALGSSDKNFNLKFIQFNFTWPNSAVGDRLYFNILNIEETLKAVLDRIKLTREGKTSIFTFAVRARFPKLAQFMATTISEKYREARLDQKRQTIHYSFEFIDEQLNTIANDLKRTELELSEYKSEHKIAILDESSRELIGAISELEAERVRTELELADHQNKASQLNKEVEEKGYFDQTFLTPRQTTETRTPFAVLLEQLSDLELQRLELLQKRRENHPDVITVTEQIEKTNAKLGEYNKNTLTSYRIIINTLRKKRNNLRAMIASYSEKLENLPAVEAKLAELIRDRNVHEKMYNMLMDKREELRVAEFSEIQDIVIVDTATLPIKPVAPKKRLNIALGIILGFLIAGSITLVQEFFTQKVTKIEDIKKNIHAPILSIIPQFSKEAEKKLEEANSSDVLVNDHFVLLMEGQHPLKESYRMLRTKLIKLSESNNNVFMISSSEENSGKTSIAASLAISLAQSKKKVLLIDADLRKSSIRKLFNIPENFPGLHDFILDKQDNPKMWYLSKEFGEKLRKNLRIIPAGEITAEASELLDSNRVGSLLDFARHEFDFVLIDTPPLTRVSDTLVLGNYCRKMLYVIRPFLTFKESIPFAQEQTKQFDIEIIGLILNAMNLKYASGYYKYGYGYGYGSEYGSEKSKNAV